MNAQVGLGGDSSQGEALSPENAVIIGTGPFAGTIVPGPSELSITTKMPLSGGIGTGWRRSFPSHDEDLGLRPCGDHRQSRRTGLSQDL